MFSFYKYCQTVFQSGYIPIRMYEKFSCTTSSATVDIDLLLNFSHSGGQEVDFIMVLLYVSLINNGMEALLHMIIDHLDILF